MNYTNEFLSGFACSPPEYLPEILKARLTFLSNLARKEHREVYLVTDEETGCKAILKITDPESPDSVKREYELLSKLDHQSIPKAISYHTDEAGREYLIRDFIPGDTLDYLLERDGVFDTRTVLETVKKLCGVLAYLHSQDPPVIYRDIKPQNIVMTSNGKVSLIDFGISREDVQEKDFDTLYVGSAAFAAPEMFGFTKSDSRTDIFTLGRLMLYLSTGTINQREAISQVESKELLRLIKKCTELSPEKRYSNVRRLIRDIDRILYPPTRKEIAIGIGAVVLCFAIGLFIQARLDKPAQDQPETLLVGAGGTGYEREVQIPVTIHTLFNGLPFSDCAVAIDNHHWFEPAPDGRAELYAFAFDEYRIRAVTGNRTAFALAAVTKDTQPLSFTFDLAKTPEAPEYLPLSLSYGAAHEIPLNIAGADAVTFAEQPDGISAEKRAGQYFLIVSGNIAAPGHYFIFAEATNAEGKADIVISLSLIEEKPVTVISTADELDKIRENLSGKYILSEDIDLSGVESWAPIGTYETPFTGEIDGMGHVISGLRIQGKQSMDILHGGLFGVVFRGSVRNIIVRDGNLYTAFAGCVGYGFIVGKNDGGLIENCAVFDGEIIADVGLESGVGGICGINFGVIKNCYNEANVTIITVGNKSWTESCAGGICGTNSGYLADSGNSGDITGISLAGGVAGFNDMGILTRCYNAGYIKAPAYFATYLPGGVSHLLGRGKIASYCAFEKGSAQVGASVFNGGTLLGIIPVDRASFRDIGALNEVFHVAPDACSFDYASADSYYPIPSGILIEQTSPPILPRTGLAISIDQLPGVVYFYTTDGTDPRMAELGGVDSISLLLKPGETIKVFAAKAGFIDSEIAEYRAVQ